MWNLTVCGEIPSSRATSLLVMPLPRAPSTSISRGVNRTGGSSGQRIEISRSWRWRTYRQPRCDGAQRGIDLGRAGVGREPAGELSANGADRDGRSRQNGIGGAVGQDCVGRRGCLHKLVPALGNERGEPVLRRRVRGQHGNAKPVADPGGRGAHLSGRMPTVTAIEKGFVGPDQMQFDLLSDRIRPEILCDRRGARDAFARDLHENVAGVQVCSGCGAVLRDAHHHQTLRLTGFGLQRFRHEDGLKRKPSQPRSTRPFESSGSSTASTVEAGMTRTRPRGPKVEMPRRPPPGSSYRPSLLPGGDGNVEGDAPIDPASGAAVP